MVKALNTKLICSGESDSSRMISGAVIEINAIEIGDRSQAYTECKHLVADARDSENSSRLWGRGTHESS